METKRLCGLNLTRDAGNSGIEFLVTRNKCDYFLNKFTELSVSLEKEQKKKIRNVFKLKSKSDVRFTVLTNPGAAVWYVKQP